MCRFSGSRFFPPFALPLIMDMACCAAGARRAPAALAPDDGSCRQDSRNRVMVFRCGSIECARADGLPMCGRSFVGPFVAPKVAPKAAVADVGFDASAALSKRKK